MGMTYENMSCQKYSHVKISKWMTLRAIYSIAIAWISWLLMGNQDILQGSLANKVANCSLYGWERKRERQRETEGEQRENLYALPYHSKQELEFFFLYFSQYALFSRGNYFWFISPQIVLSSIYEFIVLFYVCLFGSMKGFRDSVYLCCGHLVICIFIQITK